MLQKQKDFGKEYGEHKQDAEWIDIAGENLTFEKQDAVRMEEDEVTRKLMSMPALNLMYKWWGYCRELVEGRILPS